jgi:tetratricopeptide (TPR) repeat protein
MPRSEAVLALRSRLHVSIPRILVGGIILLASIASIADGTDRLESRRVCRQLLKQVRAQMEADRPDSAAIYAAQAIQCDPAQPDSYWYLAHARMALDEPVEARRIVDQGVEAAPLSQRLNLLQAGMCLESGEIPVAREIVERVLMLHRDSTEAFYMRGRIELAEGDSLTALATWRHALGEHFGDGGDR